MPTNYNFSDVFVSYSRKDHDFVRRLANALDELHYETWVDWEDIPLTADWWAEIQAGIDAANTFLYIISPHSITSQVCQQELEHAVKSNKRIVSILRAELTNEQTAKLHPDIRKHNWFVFTSNNDASFHQSLQQLLTVLTTNLNYVRSHTRYLVRAREWDAHDRDESYLLRGADALAAMEWLKSSENEHPAPLGLQQTYIMACLYRLRQDDVVQQQYMAVQFIERRAWPAFFLGLIVGMVYFFFAFPSPDPNFQLAHRLGFSLGAGATFGLVLAALSVFTDELTEIRFGNRRLVRLLAAAWYGWLFAAVGFGVLQAILFGARLDYFSILGGGFGVSLLFLLRSLFRLRSYLAFLFGTVILCSIILLFSMTPDSPWVEPRKAIFYFSDSNQRLIMALFMAVGLSLSVTGWEIAQPFLKSIRMRRQADRASR